MLRKFNYNLENGTVGTDDENIAKILYNINRMEMKKTFSSFSVKELEKALGELYFMASEAKVHLNRFLNVSGDKVDADTVSLVVAAFDEAMKSVGAVGNALTAQTELTEMAKMVAIFPEVYKKLLDIVPSVLALDAQTIGRANQSD